MLHWVCVITLKIHINNFRGSARLPSEFWGSVCQNYGSGSDLLRFGFAVPRLRFTGLETTSCSTKMALFRPRHHWLNTRLTKATVWLHVQTAATSSINCSRTESHCKCDFSMLNTCDNCYKFVSQNSAVNFVETRIICVKRLKIRVVRRIKNSW